MMCSFTIFLYFLAVCLISKASLAEASKSLSSFSVDLIHRDSPLSPYYNPSLTQSERIKNAKLRSISRSKLVSLTQNKNNYPKSITIPDSSAGEYLVRFYIGTPPVERFATADTGSDLIWVQCTPCVQCLPQKTPLFDPRKSSTYRRVRCDSQPCTLLTNFNCGNSRECMYNYGYGDNSFNNGILGVDKINFGSNGGSKALTFPKFTFGCSYYYNDTADTSMMNMGLVGIGAGPLSLVSQLGEQIGKKFSYCFPPFASNSTSKMKFGSEAITKGKGVVSTPLIRKSTASSFYYLNLEGISFGNKKMEITKSEIDGNIIIDSGTTYAVLERNIFNKFATLVKEVLGVEAVKNPPEGNDFCFRNKNNRESFPEIVFLFTGAKVIVDSKYLLGTVNDDDTLLCLFITATDDEDGSILGNQAQVGYQVEYDLGVGKVSFAPADCAKI